AGSLGVDVETTVDITLLNTEVAKIPSNARGPLVVGSLCMEELLLGRSSAGIKGLIVIPGVIDADYTGQVHIMAYTICPPLFVPKGNKIAQILPFQNFLQPSVRSKAVRGDQGFGSSGSAVCFTVKMDQRPMTKIHLSQGGQALSINAMLDSGADVTIIN
ncbi:POK9 protein, partial [Trogon melanurus]|nr:POK9 protein [Trogon melanurus]